MEDDNTQPATQPVMDGRRVGQINSELSGRDIADVLAILTASSPAAYRVVEETAATRPEHVLFPHQYDSFENQLVDIEEQETIIIDRPNLSSNGFAKGATSLVLRMSSPRINDSVGFVLGRNPQMADIVFGQDSGKRVSNQHFRIYLNAELVLMVEDMSTNGTVVDDVLLKCRDRRCHKQRMINTGSIIRIQTSNDPDFVEFIVRIPSRVAHMKEFQKNIRDFMTRCATTEEDFQALQRLGNNLLGSSRTQWDGSPNYTILGELGKGAFATVHLIATKLEGKLYAAKEIRKREFSGVMHRKLENEVKIMSGLHHPHIVQYVESVQTPEHIYIIMEYVRWGDVAKLFREQGCISEELAKTLAKQMLSALKYLHDRKITHRDIKPDNILISEKHPNAIFKLADFGLSKNVQGTFLTTFCGTLLYCAPEVFPDGNIHKQGVKRRRGQKPTQDLYDSKVDIYSLAAVLWHVTAGTPPVAPNSDRNGQGMYDNIMATMLDTTGLYAKNISEPCINILCGMLQKDPSNRPTAHRCLTHAWLDDGTTVPGDNNLESIAEEDVSQEAGEQLSQLSIHQVPEEVDDEFNDEVGDDVLDDEELNQMINVHQSKRARPDPLFPRFQLRDQEHVSSPEQSFQSRDLVSNIVGESFEAVPRPTGRQRLFGEIGESALQSSGYLNVHANEALSQVASNNGVVPDSVLPTDALAPAQPDLQQRRHLDSSGQRGLQPDASFTSPSLFGAEALVEDMNMASPQSPASNPQTPNEPVTPRTPDVPQHNSLERHSQQASNFSDSTPKAKPALNRQISLPRLPSLYYDPRDPNTHNLEHASKISGIDYVNANGSANLNEVPLPDTAKVSTQDSHVNEEAQSTPAPAVTTLPSELGIRPPPRRLGKLIATSDSFNPQLILPIDKNKTSWGRLRENDLVYEPRSDTRIPKTAFTIFWHSSDRESINQLSQEGKDWTSLENVQVGIVTGATSGITINGNLLKKTDRKGNWQYVWLHTGDIVQVYQDNHGSECLKFKCEFYFGNGKEPRPVGKSFIIQHSSSPAS